MVQSLSFLVPEGTHLGHAIKMLGQLFNHKTIVEVSCKPSKSDRSVLDKHNSGGEKESGVTAHFRAWTFKACRASMIESRTLDDWAPSERLSRIANSLSGLLAPAPLSSRSYNSNLTGMSGVTKYSQFRCTYCRCD